MRHYISLASSLLLIYSTHAFAIFCPTNFSNINFGDTIEQIQQVCGNPNSVNQYKKNLATNQVWEYYIKAPGFDQNMAKMSVLFRDDQVMNIHIRYDPYARAQICLITQNKDVRILPAFCTNPADNQNVASTDICGTSIQVGNNTQSVELACGQPAVTKNVPGTENQSIYVTEFHYNGPPRVTLIFENGKLSDRLFQ